MSRSKDLICKNLFLQIRLLEVLYGYRKIVSVKSGDSLEATISPFDIQHLHVIK